MELDTHLPDIARGDPEAFGRWLAGAEGSLRAALRPFAHRVDTEAVLQEALLRVWQVAPKVVSDGKPNGLLRMALRIAQNLALSESRRLRVDPVEDAELERLISEGAHVAPTPADPLLRAALRLCREKLPGKPALALTARLESPGEPDATLAEGLKMRLNTFLQNFTRARRLLAECLKKRGIVLTEVLR